MVRGSLKQTFGPPWGIFGISHFKLDGIGNIVVDTEHETLISCKFIQNRFKSNKYFSDLINFTSHQIKYYCHPCLILLPDDSPHF